MHESRISKQFCLLPRLSQSKWRRGGAFVLGRGRISQPGCRQFGPYAAQFFSQDPAFLVPGLPRCRPTPRGKSVAALEDWGADDGGEIGRQRGSGDLSPSFWVEQGFQPCMTASRKKRLQPLRDISGRRQKYLRPKGHIVCDRPPQASRPAPPGAADALSARGLLGLHHSSGNSLPLSCQIGPKPSCATYLTPSPTIVSCEQNCGQSLYNPAYA